MRSDRNLYSKNLIESQDEIAEMKRKFKIMNHQIEQLKEEITAKDHALVKEHFDHQKVEKQREQLKNELDKLRKLKGKAESTIEKQHAELGKLTSIIQKLESDAIQQHKEYDQVINERDILGTQLIRRNDELALLCVPLSSDSLLCVDCRILLFLQVALCDVFVAVHCTLPLSDGVGTRS